MMSMFKVAVSALVLFASATVYGHAWESHLGDLEELQANIKKLEQEMDVLAEKKKKTRDASRVERTLHRIVEIHTDLISLRRKLDNTREHLKEEHPEKAGIVDDYDSRVVASTKPVKFKTSPLSDQLDALLIKIQLKYSSFLRTGENAEELVIVEKVVNEKKKRRKERQADSYLRKRSKIRLVK